MLDKYFTTNRSLPQLEVEETGGVCAIHTHYFPQVSQNLSASLRRFYRLSNHKTEMALSLSRRIDRHKNELSRLTRQIDEVTQTQEYPLMMDWERRVMELCRQRWRLQESLSDLEDRLEKILGREVTDAV